MMAQWNDLVGIDDIVLPNQDHDPLLLFLNLWAHVVYGCVHGGIAVLDGSGTLGMCRSWLSFYDAFVRRMVGLTSALLWLTFLLRMMAVVVGLDFTDCV